MDRTPMPTPTSTPVHLPLSLVILRSATHNPFTPHSHAVSDLASAIIKHTRARTPLQQTALHTYYTSTAHSIYLLNPSTPYPDHGILTAYFHLFDDLFFFSSLATTCTLDLIPPPPPPPDIHQPAAPAPTTTTLTLGPPTRISISKISIHALTPPHHGRKVLLTAYLGILLHEMLHVFLATYGCPCPPCRALQLGAAKLGHGDAWMETAQAIEGATRRLLGLAVDLSRKWSLVVECCLSGPASCVRELEVERWGFAEGDIEALVVGFGRRVRAERRGGREFFECVREWMDE